MLDLLDQEPQASLADFVDLLETEYGVEVNKAAISKKLKELKVTYKRVKRINQAQDPKLRVDYVSRIYEYNAEQVVFVDKSTANEHTTHSRYR
jgi:arginine repressor